VPAASGNMTAQGTRPRRTGKVANAPAPLRVSGRAGSARPPAQGTRLLRERDSSGDAQHLHMAPSLHRCLLVMLSSSAAAGTPPESRLRPRTPPRFVVRFVRPLLWVTAGEPRRSWRAFDVEPPDVEPPDAEPAAAFNRVSLSLQGRPNQRSARSRSGGGPALPPSTAETVGCVCAHFVKAPPPSSGAGSTVPLSSSKHHEFQGAPWPQAYVSASSTWSPTSPLS
jgi:hypothetical protein